MPVRSWGQQSNDNSHEETLRLAVIEAPQAQEASILEKAFIEAIDTTKTTSIWQKDVNGIEAIEAVDTFEMTGVLVEESVEAFDTIGRVATPGTSERGQIEFVSTRKLAVASLPFSSPQQKVIPRGQALLCVGLLLIVLLRAINVGYAQFLGPQGWAYVLGGSASPDNNNVLKSIDQQLQQQGPTAGATAASTPHLTPQQYIDLIVQKMTLNQKLGQMMIVQFIGPSYSLDLSTMISQYNVGAVLLFAANGNIVDKGQLKGLIQQMQSNSALPLAVAIDQEGGTVDRLKGLDGARPSAMTIGVTNSPARAMAAGMQDAKDLASYGFNLNLAPVVDVTNVYNFQLDGRTYGTNAGNVTRMAEAYLQGLQHSGQVLGTLKHFPGLGDVSADPHNSVPQLYRSKSNLETIDWAPYRALIDSGNVHAIMVTHEIVHAIDDSKPSSLSSKVVTGILRNELGFQGVIMTDSLTMEGITAYYTEGQAAALAIEAGSDLLMGAATPSDVATMIEGIKQSINSGQISSQRIDDSVRRILMMKYAMGLLPIPTI